ncbi:hypothetical protein KM1_276310 [Entamoeba histolytica HM-3:IMSS]|uniref:Saposin B-type domain-containing protein n=2 Tax=Entamoeba histolytica TaxID=5759 RepID=M2RX00_ENTHI|nr:Hypothetical protein EHI5A_082910 [Entamoeba histolytica KU27]EMS14817.1 hypothetical protein KM1_276310 [Entamoeba histolytica HM-3:IMSS]
MKIISFILLFISLCFAETLKQKKKLEITKPELERFKKLVSKRIDKQLSKSPTELIHTHHLEHLKLHLTFYKKELEKLVHSKDQIDKKRIPKLSGKIRKIEIKLANEQKRINSNAKKMAKEISKSISKYRKMYVDEALQRAQGNKAATNIRKAKETFREEIDKINLDLVKQKAARHPPINHHVTKKKLEQLKLKTKILMNRTIQKIAEQNGLKQEVKKANVKKTLLKKELFEVENEQRKKLIDLVGSWREKLLDVELQIKKHHERLRFTGISAAEQKHIQIQLKELEERKKIIKKHVKEAENSIVIELRKLIRKSIERITVVGETMVILSERSAIQRNNGMMNGVRIQAKSITGNDNMWKKVNGKEIIGPMNSSQEQESRLEENKFRRVVVEESKAIEEELKRHLQRREWLKIAVQKGRNVVGELDIANNDVRMLEMGIEEIRRYVQETLVRAHSGWAIKIAEGILKRKNAFERLRKYCEKMGKKGEQWEAEFHWKAQAEIGKGINGIKQLNLELLKYALKELDIAAKQLGEGVQMNDPLIEDLRINYDEWRRVVKRSIDRLYQIERINTHFEKNKGKGKLCERCFALAKTIRSAVFEKKKQNIIFDLLKKKCDEFETIGATGRCNEVAMKLMTLYDTQSLDFITSTSHEMCQKVKMC